MSEFIGRIPVPTTTATELFPLVTDYSHGRAQKRLVITHTMGSGNAKIEQRFYVGSPATRYSFRSSRLNASLRLALRNFWEAQQGAAGAFFYDVPNEDGSTFTRKTVCFENQALTFEDLSDSICGAGVVFVEIPDPAAAPVFPLGATVSRFPNDTLADALLDQVQEIIPLVRIRVLDGSVPDILVSDRRVTIRDSRAGAPVDSLYLPRLLRVGETGGGALVSQSIDGSSDDCTFAFGNADRVMVQVANDTQLRWARVELSLYHVGSTVRLDMWAGYITDWQSDAGPEFTVKASDVLSALTLSSPVSNISRQCWRRLGQDGCLRKQIIDFQKLDELERLMSRVTYRVGKEVLDLPPETDVTYHCDLGSEARRIYKDIEEDFVAQVRDGVVTAANAMVKILRLQQVANGIAKTDDGVDHRIDTAKQKLLADTLEDIGPGEPVVVFCWFHLDLDAVHESCQALQVGLTEEDRAKGRYQTLELSGRRDELKQWQEGAAQVLAVQIQAGGEGVDFTRARYSIFYSVGYMLGKYMQARSRTHRPGQTNPVEHIHLIARNTVDVKIMRALEKRAEIIESILAEITS